MNINERVRFIRKQLKLTQEEFGERIAVAQNYLSNIEKGYRDVTEKIIKIICSEFSVNEDWLRYEKGEIFIEADSAILTELANQYNLDSLDISIIEYYAKIIPEHRAIIKNFVKGIAKSIKDDEEISATIDEIPENTIQNGDNSIERELNAYRLELEAEKKGKISSVSEDSKEYLG